LNSDTLLRKYGAPWSGLGMIVVDAGQPGEEFLVPAAPGCN
jgi:hypothetical protein